jgi:hypothetical protein
MYTSHPAWFPLSTASSTAWTFSSARPANGKEDLALLWPRYGLDLDAQNTTQGGNTHDFDLAFVSQSGVTPDVDGVEVEASADDGATWQPAKVKSKSDGSPEPARVGPRQPAPGCRWNSGEPAADAGDRRQGTDRRHRGPEAGRP